MKSALSYKLFKLSAAPLLTKEHTQKQSKGEHNQAQILRISQKGIWGNPEDMSQDHPVARGALLASWQYKHWILLLQAAPATWRWWLWTDMSGECCRKIRSKQKIRLSSPWGKSRNLQLSSPVFSVDCAYECGLCYIFVQLTGNSVQTELLGSQYCSAEEEGKGSWSQLQTAG